MRESFDARLAGALQKSLNDNGINPNGGELKQIVAHLEPFFSEELENTISDPKELSKVQADVKKKSDAKVKAEAVAKKDEALTASGQGPKLVTDKPTISGLYPITGKTGSLITIAGTNFGSTQGTSSVTFSGLTPATATQAWVSTLIQTTVPEDSMTGSVVVTVNGVPSNAHPFTVLTTQFP
jgi:hypothetical protein